ncbi:hypothetical protein CEUSTIGMA_g3572.t1 [Chlamydomonas eustigma]|uniref:Cyclic nucleotide-binding domain-containing protein n=1 Tax=Chlamydomonas eustigma TaxID=1157962 RepID=A0A250WZK7_9CHLO|nr:hypothetical protein CEUSTIGMA_g3572.t1 [Chlamydomonas eustigma]|eukprot:GAX76129.1 hypothetical protein CEUSTIGMA_g3572.t1 [Chlamydomonas eustigma]
MVEFSGATSPTEPVEAEGNEASKTTLEASKGKASVRFAGMDIDDASLRAGSATSRGGSLASVKTSRSRSRVQADSLHKGSGARASARRRRFWRKVRMRFNPLYWLHVLNKVLPIIRPESAGRTLWDLLMLLLVVYVCFVVPYEIGFGYKSIPIYVASAVPSAPPFLPPDMPLMAAPPTPPPQLIDPYYISRIDMVIQSLDDWDWVLDAMFWCDLLSNFRTAYVDETATMIRDGSKIARYYLRTWFTIDLLASVPLYNIILALATNLTPKEQKAVMFLQAIRLLRLARLLRVLERLKKTAWIRLFKLIFFIVLFVHWICCLWFFLFLMLRDVNNDIWSFEVQVPPNSTIITYFLQSYMNTYDLMIGNDTLPGNDIERAFACLVLAVGAMFYAIILGNISLLVNNMEPTASRHRLKKDITTNTIRYLGVPREISERVSEYFDYLLARNHPGSDGMQTVSQLPQSMFRDISSRMYEDNVKKVPLFASCEEAFIRYLVMKLKLQVYLTGDVVFKLGDVGHEMYFISKGHVAVLNGNNELLAMLSQGGFFGELGLLATAHRTAHCTALSDCDLSILTAIDLLLAMSNFPESASAVRLRATRRLTELQAAGKAEVRSFDEKSAPRHLQQLRQLSKNSHMDMPTEPEIFTRQGGRSSLENQQRRSAEFSALSHSIPQPLYNFSQQHYHGQNAVEDNDEKEDTVALLERVHASVAKLNTKLGSMHGSLDTIQERLLNVENTPKTVPTFNFTGDGNQGGLDLDLGRFA